MTEKNDTPAEPITTPSLSVIDNPARQRFELTLDGETAFLAYERGNGVLTLIHTEVPADLRGHQVGEHLVKAALDAGRSEGLRIVAVCPFVREYMRKHPASS
jgi:predicted GNAT family acetyltransferase